MIDTKHTPGPWITDGKAVFAKGAESSVVCYAERNTPQSASIPFDAAESNARLIAAAPEMLEALEAACKWAMTMQYGSAPWLDDAEKLVIRCGGRS